MAKSSVLGGATDKRAAPGETGYMPPQDVGQAREQWQAAVEPAAAAEAAVEPAPAPEPEPEPVKPAKAPPSLAAKADGITGPAGVTAPKAGAGGS